MSEKVTVEVTEEDTMQALSGSDKSTDKPLFGKRPAKTVGFHLAIWIPLTAFIIALIVQGKGKPGYEFAIFVYVLITLRFLAQHVSMSQLIYKPLGVVFDAVFGWIPKVIPEKFRMWVLAAIYVAVAVLFACLSPATDLGTIPQRLQSLAGIVVMTLVLYTFSRNKKAINWRTVVVGFICQFIIALFVLRTQVGVNIFYFLSSMITTFLSESTAGLEFILGAKSSNPFQYTFAVSVLPAIMFFCAVISIIYYLGAMQYVIGKFAWLMVRLMDTSGGESIVAAASPFVGMGESALLVRPFVEFMTNSELHSAMTSGFATISGSVLLAYINYTGNSPQSTSTILASCLMSVPCSMLVSKIVYPETEESITKGIVQVPESTEEKDVNALDAASKGASIGVQLALMITGSLLAIISLYQACNDLVAWAFGMLDISNWIDSTQPISIALILSYIFYPISLCVGIPPVNARKAAEFLATKIVVNEFAAYSALNAYAFSPNATANGSFPLNGVFDVRTVRLLAFALCGFANIGSIGIQISVLGVIAPTRKKDLAQLALSAMITGAFSTWISAAVAGATL
ncbi:hypothetical protein HK100_004250 [Physocladia obscura]|uniref:Uncharacterized protein n=1 Tax=Physocladia obscura TaxID=109957 RepID=A0AAD5T915_9FUNG|nr:hypothetical protein HK100_004250 [Physocladia obscura]